MDKKQQKKTPDDIVKQVFKEYDEGVAYKQSIDLYQTVDTNNDFFNDKQWGDIDAADLDKPVFNIIKPAINYYMAILISDNIAVDFGATALYDPILGPPENEMELAEQGITPEIVADILQYTTLRAFDLCSLQGNSRDFLSNCAIDGDGCMYAFYNPEKKSVDVEVLDNTNVIFGDTSTANVQSQPYILLTYRRLVKDVQREAKDNGIENWEEIKPDVDDTFQNAGFSDSVHKYVTVIHKLWRDTDSKKIHSMKVTRHAMVQEDRDLKYELYPVVWQRWEKRKNSYHGISPVSGRIPNQIFVNKTYALSMRHVINFTLPKIIYDEAALPQGWNNNPNEAIAVTGDPNKAILSGFQPPDLGGSGVGLADSVMQHTENSMGATKSALGMERAYNTSALVSQQRASSMPLDKQRFDFHDAVESLVRIFIDMFITDYGTRWVRLDSGKYEGWFDYTILNNFEPNLNVDVGAGSYWNEAFQLQVLEGMLQQGIITDPALYLEMLPEGHFADRSKAIDMIRQQQAEQQAMMEQQMMMEQQAAAGGALPAGAEQGEVATVIDPDAVMTVDAMAQLDSAGSLDEAMAMLEQMPIDVNAKNETAAWLQQNWGRRG